MKKLSIILACALVAMMSCTKSKEVHPELGDGNDEIVTVGMTDVHVEYFRNNMADLEKVDFWYWLDSDPQNKQYFEMAKREDRFELTLNDLLSDTLYRYFYLLHSISPDTSYTAEKTFHTQAFPFGTPEVVTMEVNSITHNSALCFGMVTNNGGDEVTERGVCWSLSEHPTWDGCYVASGSGLGEFSATINGLEPNTTYHVVAYAVNRKGYAYGEVISFTTSAAIPLDGLVAYYPFNGNTLDETGNGHDGTIIGEVIP